MNKKLIRQFEEAHIRVGDYASIHIKEDIDGVFDVEIEQYDNSRIRIGVRSGKDIHYIFWEDALRTLQAWKLSKK